MKINRMDHVGIIVNDLKAAKEFFLDLGLEVIGEQRIKGEWVDRIIGLKDVEDVEGIVSKLEKKGFELMGDIHNYKDIYKVCYVRGHEGIILELAEKLG